MLDIDDAAKGWIMNVAKENYWRICYWMDFDDLVQDGFLTYYRIANHYDQVSSRAQIMRLFQISYINHIHNIANKRTRDAFVFPMEDLVEVWAAEYGLIESLISNEHELSFFQAMLGKAPPAVKALMNLIASPDGPRKLRSLYRLDFDGRREMTNERFCRLLNLDPRSNDVPGAILAYFGSA